MQLGNSMFSNNVLSIEVIKISVLANAAKMMETVGWWDDFISRPTYNPYHAYQQDMADKVKL